MSLSRRHFSSDGTAVERIPLQAILTVAENQDVLNEVVCGTADCEFHHGFTHGHRLDTHLVRAQAYVFDRDLSSITIVHSCRRNE